MVRRQRIAKTRILTYFLYGLISVVKMSSDEKSHHHESSLFFRERTTLWFTRFRSEVIYCLITRPQGADKFLTEQFWKVQAQQSELDPN